MRLDEGIQIKRKATHVFNEKVKTIEAATKRCLNLTPTAVQRRHWRKVRSLW